MVGQHHLVKGRHLVQHEEIVCRGSHQKNPIP